MNTHEITQLGKKLKGVSLQNLPVCPLQVMVLSLPLEVTVMHGGCFESHNSFIRKSEQVFLSSFYKGRKWGKDSFVKFVFQVGNREFLS